MSSQTYRRPLGWRPPVDEDPTDTDHRFSPLSTSSSSYSDVGQNPTSSRKHRHDPGWVARPRNAFIIFRCEYSQMHRRRGPRIRRPPGSSTDPTLSKRAAIAWSRMTNEEKEPYKIRAEEERTDHANKHPDYRYRPQRRMILSGDRHTLRLSTTNASYPRAEMGPDSPLDLVSSSSTTPECTVSQLWLSGGSLEHAIESLRPCADWASPSTHVNISLGAAEGHPIDHFENPPFANHYNVDHAKLSSCFSTATASLVTVSLSDPMVLGWNDSPCVIEDFDSVRDRENRVPHAVGVDGMDLDSDSLLSGTPTACCEAQPLQIPGYPGPESWYMSAPENTSTRSVEALEAPNACVDIGSTPSMIISSYTTLGDAVLGTVGEPRVELTQW